MEDEVSTLAPPAPAVAPPAPAPAAAPEPSLRDMLSKSVEDANLFAPDGSVNPEAAPGQKDPAPAPAPKTGRERAPDGKFARVNKDGSEVPTEAQVKQATADLDSRLDLNPDAEDPEEQARQMETLPSTDNAPKSWKAVPKEKWAALDPVVRAEVHRRERDMTRAAQEHAPVKKFVGDFQQAIQPFAQHYAPRGIQPLQLMQNLMQADVHLSTAPAPQRAQFMAKLIKDYGIDVNMLDMALSGQDPGNDPNAGFQRMLDERLAPLTGFVQTETQRRESVARAEQERAQTVLQRMEHDTENFPHFALVAQDMADITEMAFKRKVYLTPQEAYKRAVAMNPEAQAAEQGRSGQQRAQVAHAAATRSLGASLSVNGAPAPLRQEVSPDDLRGTIEAAWANAAGR